MPKDRKPLLLYDATCKFCESGSRKAMRLASPAGLERADVNDPGIQRRFGISREAAQREMYLVNARGELSHGAWAVRDLLRLSRWAWPLAWLWKVPGFAALAQKIYLWVADHRYMFMGRIAEEACEEGACSVHMGRQSPRDAASKDRRPAGR